MAKSWFYWQLQSFEADFRNNKKMQFFIITNDFCKKMHRCISAFCTHIDMCVVHLHFLHGMNLQFSTIAVRIYFFMFYMRICAYFGVRFMSIGVEFVLGTKRTLKRNLIMQYLLQSITYSRIKMHTIVNASVNSSIIHRTNLLTYSISHRPGFDCMLSFAPVFHWCCSTPQRFPGVGRNTLFLSS